MKKGPERSRNHPETLNDRSLRQKAGLGSTFRDDPKDPNFHANTANNVRQLREELSEEYHGIERRLRTHSMFVGLEGKESPLPVEETMQAAIASIKTREAEVVLVKLSGKSESQMVPFEELDSEARTRAILQNAQIKVYCDVVYGHNDYVVRPSVSIQNVEKYIKRGSHELESALLTKNITLHIGTSREQIFSFVRGSSVELKSRLRNSRSSEMATNTIVTTEAFFVCGSPKKPSGTT
jgi:hypothetical protein